jgi:hypothetical protein
MILATISGNPYPGFNPEKKQIDQKTTKKVTSNQTIMLVMNTLFQMTSKEPMLWRVRKFSTELK